MLVTVVLTAQPHEPLATRRCLALSGGTLLLLWSAQLVRNDALYLLVAFWYMLVLVCLEMREQRVRTLFNVLFLWLLTSFPFNTVIFVLNVKGVDALTEDGPLLHALEAMFAVLVILWLMYERKRYEGGLALRFGVAEWLMASFLFQLTVMLGVVMNPNSGMLSVDILRTASGLFFVVTVTLLVVCLNVLFPVMVWRRRVSSYYQRLNSESRQQAADEMAYFARYKATQKDIRAFRHDMRHHLARMQQLCEAGDTVALAAYLQDLQKDWQAHDARLYRTGNDNLDAILNGCALQLEEAGIAVTVEGAFSTALKLSPYDMTTIFANAIQNAIEANHQLPDGEARWLMLSVRRNAQFYLVTLENPLAHPLASGRRTQKKDTRNHGFGLQSMRDKVEKNGGSLEITQSAECFSLRIFLPV